MAPDSLTLRATDYHAPPLRADDPHERDLAVRVRAGDRSALEAIYREHYRGLVGFAHTYLRSEAIAEEIVQDVFLSIWCRRERWEPGASIRGYLFQGARNRAISRLRHAAVVRSVADGIGGEDLPIAMAQSCSDPHQEAELSELSCAAQEAIDRLPARMKTAFSLCRDHGLSYAEAARVMGVADDTVKNHMAKALKVIRVALAPWLC